jgi:hypothetical protein
MLLSGEYVSRHLKVVGDLPTHLLIGQDWEGGGRRTKSIERRGEREEGGKEPPSVNVGARGRAPSRTFTHAYTLTSTHTHNLAPKRTPKSHARSLLSYLPFSLPVSPSPSLSPLVPFSLHLTPWCACMHTALSVASPFEVPAAARGLIVHWYTDEN